MRPTLLQFVSIRLWPQQSMPSSPKAPIMLVVFFIHGFSNDRRQQLSPGGRGHNEIDFEFLGNSSVDLYIFHTNVYSQGKENREQQFHLWFDPTKAFTHTPLIGLHKVSSCVVFRGQRSYKGVPKLGNNRHSIPKKPTYENDWATRGGLVKTDWTKTPFTASYRNINVNACVVSSGSSSCGSKFTDSLQGGTQNDQGVDAKSRNRIRWVQSKYMIYNYCTDFKRFPQSVPTECKRSRLL
ncbi:unnamed protein product [Citrullus colocynthis]|uniref:Xyloglucan endotransglucosylase/hydrolase n=1 Tax=Citrullus colocynthis TaxID=252529 RepID=A0ABP0XK71_9ROSI